MSIHTAPDLFVRLRTDERHAEKARVLGLSQSGDNTASTSAQQQTLVQSIGSSMTRTNSPSSKGAAISAEGPGAVSGGVLKGHVRRSKGGELKPVRYFVHSIRREECNMISVLACEQVVR